MKHHKKRIIRFSSLERNIIFKRLVIIIFLFLPMSNGYVLAGTTSFTVEELDKFINDALSKGDSDLSGLLAGKVQEKLDASNLTLQNGSLVFDEVDATTKRVSDRCSARVDQRSLATNIKLKSDTTFAFTLDAVDKPIIVTANVSGKLSATGKYRAKTGRWVRYPTFRGWKKKCIRHRAWDNFSVTMGADVDLVMTLQMELFPEFIEDPQTGDITARLKPLVAVTGELTSLRNKVVDINGVGPGIGPDFLLDNDLFNLNATTFLLEEWVKHRKFTLRELQTKLTGAMKNQADRQTESLAKKFLSEQEFNSWKYVGGNPLGAEIPFPRAAYAVDFTLPSIDKRLLTLIAKLFNVDSSPFPIAIEYIQAHKRDLFDNLLMGNSVKIKELLSTAAACEASQLLMSDLAVSADVPTPFTVTTPVDFCSTNLGNGNLGNASDLVSDADWTLTPGNRYNIGVLSIKDNYQPYMKRVKYREVEVSRGDGMCELEMRVYKNEASATDFKPLLAIHGGSWKYRGLGFFALESQISHYTNRGFVVFAPFYRLVGDSDGNIECNGPEVSWQEITADVDAALNWVISNSSTYGAIGKPVIMGQSAGAHLAGYLTVYRSHEIDRALLLYPPMDFADLSDQFKIGDYKNENGISLVSNFINEPLLDADPSSPAIFNNSFPDRIAENFSSIPPMFLLHGVADSLVPSRQSVRTCNALSGSLDSGPAMDDGGDIAEGVYRKTYDCDQQGSQLHLFAEAGHGLDACIKILGDVFSQCPAGGIESQAAVADSLTESLRWVSVNANCKTCPVNEVDETQDISDADSSGGGAAGVLLFVLMISLFLSRKKLM